MWGYGADRTGSEVIRAELLVRPSLGASTVQAQQDKRDLCYDGFRLIAQGRFEEALPLLQKALELYRAEFQAHGHQNDLLESIHIQGRLLQYYFGMADYQGVPETPQVVAQQQRFYQELLATLHSSMQSYRTFLAVSVETQPRIDDLADAIAQSVRLLDALRVDYTQQLPALHALDTQLEQRATLVAALGETLAGQIYKPSGSLEERLEVFTLLDATVGQIVQAITDDIEQVQTLNHSQASEEREQLDQITSYLQAIPVMLESKSRLIRQKKSQFQQNMQYIWQPAFELSQWLERWRVRLLTDAARIDALEGGQTFFQQIIAFFAESGHHAEALVLSERARSRAFIDLLAARAQGANSAEHALLRLRPAPPATREELLEIVQQRKSLTVEYFFTEEQLLVWVITPEGTITGSPLPGRRDEIVTLISEFVAITTITSADHQTRPELSKRTNEILRMLYIYLIQPIRPYLAQLTEEDILTIIPHEHLFLLPFGALRDEQGQHLIARHTLVYAPSIDLLQYTRLNREHVIHADAPNLLAFVNPQTDLTYTEHHFEAITAFYTQSTANRVYMGRQARKERLWQEASNYTVLCFATHAKAFNDQPLDSYLALAALPPEDGLLKVPDISLLDLHTDLVILSARETGLGKISGDGVIGLNRAFIVAGTPSLIMSLWSIPEEESLNQVYLFHDVWRGQGMSKAQALRQAQLEGLLNYPDQVGVWAGFVLVGEWM